VSFSRLNAQNKPSLALLCVGVFAPELAPEILTGPPSDPGVVPAVQSIAGDFCAYTLKAGGRKTCQPDDADAWVGGGDGSADFGRVSVRSVAPGTVEDPRLAALLAFQLRVMAAVPTMADFELPP
jgi:hypothetical protein